MCATSCDRLRFENGSGEAPAEPPIRISPKEKVARRAAIRRVPIVSQRGGFWTVGRKLAAPQERRPPDSWSSFNRLLSAPFAGRTAYLPPSRIATTTLTPFVRGGQGGRVNLSDGTPTTTGPSGRSRRERRQNRCGRSLDRSYHLIRRPDRRVCLRRINRQVLGSSRSRGAHFSAIYNAARDLLRHPVMQDRQIVCHAFPF